jgi:hypothetical protein
LFLSFAAPPIEESNRAAQQGNETTRRKLRWEPAFFRQATKPAPAAAACGKRANTLDSR